LLAAILLVAVATFDGSADCSQQPLPVGRSLVQEEVAGLEVDDQCELNSERCAISALQIHGSKLAYSDVPVRKTAEPEDNKHSNDLSESEVDESEVNESEMEESEMDAEVDTIALVQEEYSFGDVWLFGSTEKCCLCKDGVVGWSASGKCSFCKSKAAKTQRVSADCVKNSKTFKGSKACAGSCKTVLGVVQEATEPIAED